MSIDPTTMEELLANETVQGSLRPLRTGETVEGTDFERAKQLLADKRAKGPAPKRTTTRRTTTTRKAPAKK